MTNQTLEPTALTTPTAVVDRFLAALSCADFDTVEALFDDDVLYQNVGFSKIRGRHRVMKFIKGLDNPSAGLEVKIHRSAADGATVLNERTDALTFGRFRMQFWVCGVFEVREGRITLWRDYFDFYDFTKNAIRGLVAMAIPALRKRF